MLHLDADLYSSYLDVLFQLYDLLELGGQLVCDDCGYITEAGRAVDDFHLLHGIDTEMSIAASNYTRYWTKARQVELDRKAYDCWKQHRLPWGLVTSCRGLSIPELWDESGPILRRSRGDFEQAAVVCGADELLLGR